MTSDELLKPVATYGSSPRYWPCNPYSILRDFDRWFAVELARQLWTPEVIGMRITVASAAPDATFSIGLMTSTVV